MVAQMLGVCQVSGELNDRKLERSVPAAYHEKEMGVHGGSIRGKRAVAAETWRLVLECSMAQVGRASGILQRLGLTPGHMKLLMQLDENEGRAMGTLAHSFRCDASTMTWLVDRLEERGLVERRMLPGDRRVKAVALTPLGVETKDELAKRLYEPPAELLSLDRDALERLRGALTKIRDAGQEALVGAPGSVTGAARSTG
jgi:DNA-binding MarR family transcriptional regulator